MVTGAGLILKNYLEPIMQQKIEQDIYRDNTDDRYNPL